MLKLTDFFSPIEVSHICIVGHCVISSHSVRCLCEILLLSLHHVVMKVRVTNQGQCLN